MKKKSSENQRKSGRFSLVLSLVLVIAAAVFSWFFLSIERVTGNAMYPTLQAGDLILVLKAGDVQRGDVITFYHGDKRMVRRCIGGPGDMIEIDENGTVSVNGSVLEEPYTYCKALGDGDMQYPFQVPANRYFVLSDDREFAVDSRLQSIGGISAQQVVGKAVIRIWPLRNLIIE